jgi:hypothetical protein
VFTAGGFFEKAMHGENGKWSGQLGGGDEDDRHRMLLIKKADYSHGGGIVTAGFARWSA